MTSGRRLVALWVSGVVLLAAAVILVPPLVASIVSPAQAPHLASVSDQALTTNGISLGPAPAPPPACVQFIAAANQLGHGRDIALHACPGIYERSVAEGQGGQVGLKSPTITEAVHADCSVTAAHLYHRDCWVLVVNTPYGYDAGLRGQTSILVSGQSPPGPRSTPDWYGAPGTYLVFIDAQSKRPLAAVQVADQRGIPVPQTVPSR